LGNPTNIARAGQAGRRIQMAEADRFAANLLPIIKSIQSAGPIGMVAIAKLLNERGVRTARDGQWHVSSVANLLARANNFAAR
jgi:arylsulfatase A-like enzyme